MFAKNFSKLVSTTVIIQVVSFLIYPMITRNWAPADFGQFSLLISVGNILSIFSTGQFHVGAMVEPDLARSNSLIAAAKFFNLCSASIVAVVVLIVAPDPRWYLLPLFLFFYAAYEILRVQTIRDKAINRLTGGQMISRIGANLLKLVPGPSVFLICSEVIGNFSAALFLGKIRFKEIFVFQRPHFPLLKEFKKYPIFYSLNLGTQALTYELPAILLGLQHENYLIGIYGMCQRLLIQPLTVISNNVFTAIFSMPLSSEERTKKCVKIAIGAVSIGIVLKICFVLFGNDLLGKFLGAKWSSGKEFFAIFSFILITKVLGNMALANYISSYRLETSTAIRLLQVACIVVSYFICGEDKFLFFKVFVGIDMFFDITAFGISLRAVQTP